MTTRVCACGKIAHPNERLAEVHRRELAAKTTRPRRIKVYQCIHGPWHVGHTDKVRLHDAR